MASDAEELRAQLAAARLWLTFLVEELELEPEETTFVVSVVSSAGDKTEKVRVTLADSLAKIDAALAKATPPQSTQTDG